jgi:Tfp pilus assembly protein PilF
MVSDGPRAPPAAAMAAAIERALVAVETSAAFRHSRRHRQLLRYLVTQTLSGQHAALKEIVLAVEVFGRPVDRFDPRTDTIVRVETRRLRARLARYYAGEGRADRLRIDVPVGSYVPQFSRRAPTGRAAAATRRARDLVERGEHFLRLPTSRSHLEQAIERFDQAQRESPACAPAFVGLARAWFNLASGWYCDPKPAGDHAIEALERALALDSGDATAWALLGAFQYQFEYDWGAAQRSFRRALARGPRSAFVHTAYGWQLTARGELERAERELSLARELDPQYVNSRIHMVNLRVAQGRLADAQQELDAMHDIAPDSMVVVGMGAALALFRGEASRAVSLYERCCEMAPEHPGPKALLAAALAAAGKQHAAGQRMAELRSRFADRVLSPYVLAICAARCGERDAAIELLQRALDHHDPQAVLFAQDPSFISLRDHPAWPALRRRLGLV